MTTIERLQDLEPSEAETTSSEEEPREPCPTPLSWRQVVEVFGTESRRHDVQLDGRHAVARSWGEPSRPTQLLLGGATTTPRMLALLAHLLREEFHVVVLETPAADAPGRPRRRSTNDFAAELVAAADACGAERFSLFAAGWGSGIALQTMLDHGPRVERAVLCGGFARMRYSLTEGVAIRLARSLPARLGSAPLFGRMLEQNHRRWFPPFDHSRWEFLAEESASVPMRLAGTRSASLLRADFRERLQEIEQPVLVLRTEGEGRVAGARVEELAAALPNGRLEWMPSTGQLPFLTHPHRIAKLIKTYFAETSPTPPK